MEGPSPGRLGIPPASKPLVRAGLVLGFGLGGFFDGIVIHQILQWHHMLSAHPDPSVAGDLRMNVLADGLFHAATYAFTVAGVGLLWRAWGRVPDRPTGRTLVGAVAAGWGLFNLVEGTVNHQLLGVHHVRPDGPGGILLWDAAFLLWGVGFLAGGWLLVRSGTLAAASGGGADGTG